VWLKLLAQGTSLCRLKHLIEGTGGMGVQMVLHQTHIFDMLVVLVHHVLHALRIIYRGSPLTNCHIPKARMRLKGKEDTTRTIFGLCIVVACGFARTQRQDCPHIFNEKAGTFIKANKRSQGIVRQGILMQDIFPVP
jgi:hypothetical protein